MHLNKAQPVQYIISFRSRLGGVMANVYAIGPKVRWFKPPHVVRFYGMLKNPAECERYISRAKFIISTKILLLCSLHNSVGKISRELWWRNQEFPLSISFNYVSPCSYITCSMDTRPDYGLDSEM
jgi:hypothetical protein